MSWFSYRPYVSVGERRRKAEVAAKKIARGGGGCDPVRIEGRKITTTYWGTAWCDNLEAYRDFANRLPRGRSYVRNGSVIDLKITSGKITALVQGSELYRISVTVNPLKASRWQQFKAACAGKVTNLLDLLQGRLSKEILADIVARETGLFPSSGEIRLTCSCPDSAEMCKHVAAALYGIGARLDTKPELFFTLRGVDMQELITAASAEANAAPTAGAALDNSDLSEIFGVDIDTGDYVTAVVAEEPEPAPKASRKPRPPRPTPVAKKIASKGKSAPPKAKARARKKKPTMPTPSAGKRARTSTKR